MVGRGASAEPIVSHPSRGRPLPHRLARRPAARRAVRRSDRRAGVVAAAAERRGQPRVGSALARRAVARVAATHPDVGRRGAEPPRAAAGACVGSEAAGRDCGRHLTATLRADAEVERNDCEDWLDRWVSPLGRLTKPMLAEVDLKLALRDDGKPLAPSTASRYRKLARACIRRAVEIGVLENDPWPPAPRGRAQRKSAKTNRAVIVRQLPDPTAMQRNPRCDREPSAGEQDVSDA